MVQVSPGKCVKLYLKITIARARCQWLTPVILATQKAEIRRSQFEARLGY
jgi:hypothetical protein